ncbi:MAG: Acetoin dehydrogenase operon transcriptional activator AcoR [Syntrophus sp. SKADARSKE-3]|nr:Acetoin dehydrogenase operon transcriptional activator AcoR [Syntrophus sp. SKADARSKE-3]
MTTPGIPVTATPAFAGPESLMLNYDDKFQKTLREWDRYIKGDLEIDTLVIPYEILESWRRCRAYGVNPRRAKIGQALSEAELADILDDNEELISISLPFMTHLYRFVEGSGFIVALFNHEGYLLEIMGDALDVSHVRTGNFVPGASWCEERAGTNGIGTQLKVRKPLQIFGCQHFCRNFHKETASSAPIFSPGGEFLGGLVLTGRYLRATPHTLGMTVAAAVAIENELRINKALAEVQIASSYQKTVISSIPEALIAIDNVGCISLINDNALKMFSLSRQEVTGRPIREVFGAGNDNFFRKLENNLTLTDSEVHIATVNGANDYTLTLNPILSQNGTVIGRILILNEYRRAKTLVAKMIGAKANFRFEDIHGVDHGFMETVKHARLASRTSSNVLLLGESGTGKDIFAQAIHNASNRRNGPYIAINCAAIPRDLITSELFGHTEGAFTGARRGGSQGKFELADGGTIFLDEIAETPLELQAVLLRVIEDKSIVRIGGTHVRPVDVRIIAATNKDLLEAVRKGSFRHDLYYRANVLTIRIASLRDRKDDIPLLVDAFIKKVSRTLGKKIEDIDEKVIEAFMNYSWPGNVRELQNIIERMMNFATGNKLTADLIPEELIQPPRLFTVGDTFESARDMEYRMIKKMLVLNIPKMDMAKKLKISRSSLYRKLEKYGLL